eukprot:6323829-Prymnesium_polylepis.1
MLSTRLLASRRSRGGSRRSTPKVVEARVEAVHAKGAQPKSDPTHLRHSVKRRTTVCARPDAASG